LSLFHYIIIYTQGIDVKACDCLKWKYRANGHLEAGRIALAIETYDKAVMAATYIANPTIQMQQEGTILLMRATAYLQRAKEHKLVLQKIVQELDAIPEQPDAMIPLLDAVVMMGDRSIPALGPPLFRRMISDTRHYEKVFRRTQYRHGLYQYALLHAAQDSLRATQLCPAVPQAWLRAAETLADLWKVSESAQYYQQAQRLDETLAPTVQVVIDKLQRRQELLDHARAYGWSEDTLRLALDVAG
jgi:tetratricopeptide (TPR) repeat protein